MAPWLLPAVASAFGAGLLLAGEDASRIPAGPVLGVGAMLLACWWVAAAGARARARERRAPSVLVAAGLWRGEPPLGPRERILRAAGIPVADRTLDGASPAGGRRPGATAVAALLAAATFLGAGWASLRSPDPERLAGLDGRFVRFSGTAASDLRRYEFGWGLEARVEGVHGLGESSARLWISGSGEAPDVQAGQPVAGAGTVRALDADPSGFERYLRSRGVVGTVSATSLEALGPPANPALRLANAAREALRRGAFLVFPDREAGLFLGLSIGDTSAMDPEVERDFRATGLGHLLAVSGGNVAMFLVPVLALAIAIRASGAARVGIGVAAVAFFALVTRWEPSVLRASVMAVVALCGSLAGRPRSTAATLAAAALVLLVADPALARSLGFQLSVSATAGMAALASPIATRLRVLPRPVALAAAATLSAQIGVTPVLLLSFGVVPTVTLLANLVAFPAVGPALLGGVLAAGAALAWGPAGRFLGRLAAPFLSYLAAAADVLARAPLPSITGTGVIPPLLAAGAAAIVVWRLRRGRRRTGTLIAILAAGALSWASLPAAGPRRGP